MGKWKFLHKVEHLVNMPKHVWFSCIWWRPSRTMAFALFFCINSLFPLIISLSLKFMHMLRQHCRSSKLVIFIDSCTDFFSQLFTSVPHECPRLHELDVCHTLIPYATKDSNSYCCQCLHSAAFYAMAMNCLVGLRCWQERGLISTTM